MNPAVPAPGPPSPTSVTAGGRDPLPTPPALGSGVRTAATRKWMGRRGGPAAQLGAREKFPGASEGVGGTEVGSSLLPQHWDVPDPDRRAVGVLGRSLRALAVVWMWASTLVSRQDLHLYPPFLCISACVPRVQLHCVAGTGMPALPSPLSRGPRRPWAPLLVRFHLLPICGFTRVTLGLSPWPTPHLSIGQDTSSRRVPPFPSPTTSTPTWQRGN